MTKYRKRKIFKVFWVDIENPIDVMKTKIKTK